MSDLSLAIWVGTMVLLLLVFVARQRAARGLTSEHKLAVLDALRTPRYVLSVFLILFGIAWFVTLQKAPAVSVPVAEVGLVTMAAMSTFMFFRLLRLDLPRGFVALWGACVAIIPLGVAAWWISLRYAG